MRSYNLSTIRHSIIALRCSAATFSVFAAANKVMLYCSHARTLFALTQKHRQREKEKEKCINSTY